MKNEKIEKNDFLDLNLNKTPLKNKYKQNKK